MHKAYRKDTVSGSCDNIKIIFREYEIDSETNVSLASIFKSIGPVNRFSNSTAFKFKEICPVHTLNRACDDSKFKEELRLKNTSKNDCRKSLTNDGKVDLSAKEADDFKFQQKILENFPIKKLKLVLKNCLDPKNISKHDEKLRLEMHDQMKFLNIGINESITHKLRDSNNSKCPKAPTMLSSQCSKENQLLQKCSDLSFKNNDRITELSSASFIENNALNPFNDPEKLFMEKYNERKSHLLDRVEEARMTRKFNLELIRKRNSSGVKKFN